MLQKMIVPRAAALAVFLLVAGNASAATVTLSFGNLFSGSSPAGAAPWLTATFTDEVSGGVRLEVVAGGLTGDESIDGLYFNFDPLLNTTSLVFTRDASSTGPSAANTAILLGTNEFRADGDGFFDIQFDLPPPPGSQAARFTAGETLVYHITAPVGVAAASFAFLSAPGPGGSPAPQYAAAHIQQIGGSDGGWVGATLVPVPLPGALALIASGFAALGGALRRRRLA